MKIIDMIRYYFFFFFVVVDVNGRTKSYVRRPSNDNSGGRDLQTYHLSDPIIDATNADPVDLYPLGRQVRSCQFIWFSSRHNSNPSKNMPSSLLDIIDVKEIVMTIHR
jgi:hypothetical protein